MAELVNVKGLSELQNLLDTLPAKLEANIMRGALRAGMRVIQVEAKEAVPVRTGTLRAGLKVSTQSKGGIVQARLRVTGKHAYVANWLEFTGAKAHDIKPKNAKALSIAGAFDELIHHPGMHAKPFLRPALDGRAQDAVVATGEYIKQRLATKEGLNTADIDIEAEA